LVFGVWCLVFGVWCLVFGVWCLVFGVWCLAFGVWRLAFEAPTPSLPPKGEGRLTAYVSRYSICLRSQKWKILSTF
jgi:hypothetical protein